MPPDLRKFLGTLVASVLAYVLLIVTLATLCMPETERVPSNGAAVHHK
jgi:hypothetical protein